jgi:dihydroorotate dehydrogenase
MYGLLRRLLFLMDAEKAHYFTMRALRIISKSPLSFFLKSFRTRGSSLQKKAFGLVFENPVGLAAGFDKNAEWISELSLLGFGFVEIGTVTPKPQAGNEKPRLFRLPKDKALINRMGFNNAGVQAVADNLRKWKSSEKGRQSGMIIGANIGKNKDTANEDAWKDYLICFEALHDLADYFVINVSSPNTPGLRDLQQKEKISELLTKLLDRNKSYPNQKPVLLKIAPDLSEEELRDMAAVAMETKLDGFVIANTTISRYGLHTSPGEIKKIGAGGLSGFPLRERSDNMIRIFHQLTGGNIPIIGSGGVFTGEDAKEKINAGASLVQVWTGFVYQGPVIIKNICKHLLK